MQRDEHSEQGWRWPRLFFALGLVTIVCTPAPGAAQLPDSMTKARAWASANGTDANAIVSDVCARVDAANTSSSVKEERTKVAQSKTQGEKLIAALQKTLEGTELDLDKLNEEIDQRTATITAKLDADLETIRDELESLSSEYEKKKAAADEIDAQMEQLNEFLGGTGPTLNELVERVLESDEYMSSHWNSAAPEYSQHERDRRTNLAAIKRKLKVLQDMGLRVPDPNVFELVTTRYRARLPREAVQNLIGQLETEQARIETLRYEHAQDPVLQRFPDLRSTEKSKVAERKKLLANDEKLRALEKQRKKMREQRLEAQTQAGQLNDRIAALDRANAGIRACVEARLQTLIEKKQQLLAAKQSDYDSIKERLVQRKKALIEKIGTVMEEFRKQQKIVRCPALRKVLLARAQKLRENLGQIPPEDERDIMNEWKQAGCWFPPEEKNATIARWRAEYDRNVDAKKKRVREQAKDLWLEIRRDASRDMLQKIIHALDPVLPTSEHDYDEVDRDIDLLIENARNDIRNWLGAASRGESPVDVGSMIMGFRPWQGLELGSDIASKSSTPRWRLRFSKVDITEYGHDGVKNVSEQTSPTGATSFQYRKTDNSFGREAVLSASGTCQYAFPAQLDQPQDGGKGKLTLKASANAAFSNEKLSGGWALRLSVVVYSTSTVKDEAKQPMRNGTWTWSADVAAEGALEISSFTKPRKARIECFVRSNGGGKFAPYRRFKFEAMYLPEQVSP